MRSPALLAALVATILPATRAFAADCHAPGDESAKLWIAPVSMDDVYPSHPAGSIDTWEFTKQRYYYQQINKATPEEACALYAKYYVGSFTAAQRNLSDVKLVSNGTAYKCAFDCQGSHGGGFGNGNGAVDAADYSGCSANINPVHDTDEVCDLEPNLSRAPHRGAYMPPSGQHFVRGANFTDPTQKNLIKADNYEFGYLNLTTHVATYFYSSDASNVLLPNGNPVDVDSLTSTTGLSNSVEVDHLIPRVDKFGCGCGTNSPVNALLVSRGLNNSMSNDITNDSRKALLAYYTSPATPLVGPSNNDSSLSNEAADETQGPDDPSASTSDEIGGCSAGRGNIGGYGLMALVLGIGKLARRRRRA